MQNWDKIAEHVRGGWEAMQQQNCWTIAGASFAVKDI
jgi:hypothetical protein